MMNLPKRPSGGNAGWFDKVWSFIRASRVIPGRGLMGNQTPNGLVLSVKESSAASGVTYRWTKICVDGEEKWAQVARSVVYDELPEGVEEPTE